MYQKPVTYSATGTHAMYATPGFHPYILPLGILHDLTDRGPLWDPLLNSHTYTYDHLTDDLRASNITPQAPTNWFYFAGHWGDKFYPLDDARQYEFAGQYHYVSGPLGPRFKNLGRRKVCQGGYNDPCVIKNWLLPATVKYWKGMGDGETERNIQSWEMLDFSLTPFKLSCYTQLIDFSFIGLLNRLMIFHWETRGWMIATPFDFSANVISEVFTETVIYMWTTTFQSRKGVYPLKYLSIGRTDIFCQDTTLYSMTHQLLYYISWSTEGKKWPSSLINAETFPLFPSFATSSYYDPRACFSNHLRVSGRFKSSLSPSIKLRPWQRPWINLTIIKDLKHVSTITSKYRCFFENAFSPPSNKHADLYWIIQHYHYPKTDF